MSYSEGYEEGYRDALEELIRYHRERLISSRRSYGKYRREGLSGGYFKDEVAKQKYVLWSARWNLENQ